MPMAKITPMGESGLYHIHFLDRTDPGFGHGPGQGTDPGYGHPIGGHPDQGLPGHGHPGNRPPGSGAHPGNRPPGSGSGIPDNELPDHPPPQLAPGYTIVMVRGPHGKWEYAFIAPGSPPPRPLPPQGGGRPDQGLPGQGGHPDQGLPGSQPHPDQGLPGMPPHASGQPIPGQPGHPSGQPTPPQPQPTPQHR